MNKYSEFGKEMYRKYCAINGNKPIMLPRAPEQTYIDVSSNCEDDKRHQSDYETEVVVYRALERVDEGFIVLHSFEYTHHQYRICDSRHVRKGCKQCKTAAALDGHCDFIINYGNCFVVIDVKNVDHEMEYFLHEGEQFKRSVQSRNKVTKLVKCINDDVMILQYTAFPSSSKHDDRVELSLDQKKTVIFKEDLEHFSDWWNANIMINSQIRQTSPAWKQSPDEVSSVLLAIWSTERDDCDPSMLSLRRCIRDI